MTLSLGLSGHLLGWWLSNPGLLGSVCSLGDAREGNNPAELGLGCRAPRATSPPCRADRGSALVLGAAGRSQAVTPCLLLGTWPPVPSLSWSTPGLSPPSLDSRFLFSLPVSLANSLPWTHPGLLGHRLVSPLLPACCRHCLRSARPLASPGSWPNAAALPRHGAEPGAPSPRDSVPSPSEPALCASRQPVLPSNPVLGQALTPFPLGLRLRGSIFLWPGFQGVSGGRFYESG